MDPSGYRLIGFGLYTIPEASRLTGVPVYSIRRWTSGYWYTFRGERRFSTPTVKPKIEPVGGTAVLSFRELQEIRFLHAFRRQGVSWHVLRLASERAKKIIDNAHPFSTGRFRSLGNSILTEVARTAGDPVLWHIVENQLALKRVLAPYLRGLEFQHDEPIRWFPEEHRLIVVDPGRSFGQPVLEKEGVPTRILARSFKVERSYRIVARWYELNVMSVKAAVAFEKRLAA